MESGLIKGILPGDRPWLAERFGQNALFDEPLAKHTSLGVGGPAQVLVQVQDMAGLKDLVQWTGEKDLPYFLLGRGTNLLVRDKGVQGIVILLSGEFGIIQALATEDGETVIEAGAGAGLIALSSFAIKNGLEGLNFGVGIPGTVGGAILMNAGTYEGCVADTIQEVWFMTPEGEEVHLEAGRMAWDYRKMKHPLEGKPARAPIIVKGFFKTRRQDPDKLKRQAEEHMKRRRATQPRGVRSAGSFFKNPPGEKSAGELIDKAGLKGKSIGGAMVSPAHGNWIVNTGNATATDILSLMELVQDAVFKFYGIRLEPEVKIVGT